MSVQWLDTSVCENESVVFEEYDSGSHVQHVLCAQLLFFRGFFSVCFLHVSPPTVIFSLCSQRPYRSRISPIHMLTVAWQTRLKNSKNNWSFFLQGSSGGCVCAGSCLAVQRLAVAAAWWIPCRHFRQKWVIHTMKFFIYLYVACRFTWRFMWRF